MMAAIEATFPEHDLAPLRHELTRVELLYLHNQAVGIAATFAEFFPHRRRPSDCPFDRKPAPAGTLAAFMQRNRP